MNCIALIRQGFFACLAAAMMLALPSAAYSEVVYETDFPEAENTLPTDWTVVVGTSGSSGWHIGADGDFRYDGSGNAIATYTGLLSNGSSASMLEDFTIETEIRKSSSGITGVVARLQNSSNFYHARLEGTNQLELYRFLNGSATMLGSTAYTSENYTPGETWLLSLTAVGSTLRASLYDENDVLMATLEQTDSTFTSGYAGVRGSSPSAYETFSINKIPEPSTLVMLSGLVGIGLLAHLRRGRRS